VQLVRGARRLGVSDARRGGGPKRRGGAREGRGQVVFLLPAPPPPPPPANTAPPPPAITPPIPARIRQERISSRERNLAISASNWRPDRSHRSPCGRYNRMRRRSAVTSSG